MLVIGLIGSVCSGKSSVAKVLRERGAEVFSADEAVRDIYRREDVKRRVREAFGDGVFTADGEVDRKALARRVFSNGERLKVLTEGIVYPIVRAQMEEFVRTARERNPKAKAVVLDAPTLLEAGCGDLCDRIIFVTAPIERRREWAAAGRGWEEGEIERRESHALSEDEKRKAADAVIENTGSMDELRVRAMEVWRELANGV
jgi:dephospho-CoA kinase